MRRNLAVAAALTGMASMLGAVGPSAAPAATIGNARTIHLAAHIIQQAFTGDPNNPQLGDRLVVSGDVFNDSKAKVGRTAFSCSVVSVPPRETEAECLGDIVLPQGKITVGGLVPFPPSAAPARFAVLGGTDDFLKARGDFVTTTTSPDTAHGTLHLFD
jgi:allene oxide cyclase-like protein